MRTHLLYIAAIAGLLIVVFVLMQINSGQKSIIDQKDSAINEKNDSIEYYRNERGHLIAEKDAAVLSASETAKAYPAVVEELRREFDVEVKDMKAYVHNEFEARGSGTPTVVHNHYIDSAGNQVPYREVKVSDGYLEFSATVFESPLFDSLKSHYEYTYTDFITTVISKRKKWFLGKEIIQAQSRLGNPEAKVTNTTNILEKSAKDNRWGVMIGASYIPFAEEYKVQPTVTVGYNLIKW